MKCFYNPTQDAIGACRSCGKGLSKEYAVDLGKGLACKGRCEDEVRKLIALVDRNISLSSTNHSLLKGRAFYATPFFHLPLGVICLITGVVLEFDFLFIVLGALFIAYGLFTFGRARTVKATTEPSSEPSAPAD